MPQRSSRDLLLAGDIGGTHTRLRLYDGAQRVVHEAVFPSRGTSLAAIVRAYLTSQKARIAAAVLGIAGPVVKGAVRGTNLPWSADEKRLARALHIPRLKLVNDLAAVAVGCIRVSRASKVVVAKGRSFAESNMAVIAAGTGLGEALLIWDGHQFIPCATEGGHADFGPTSDEQIHLLEHLRHRMPGGHVSTEQVLSGPGLGRMYDFYVEHLGPRALAKEKATIAPRLRSGDRNAIIAELGLARESPSAACAVDLFASVYGAEAGNLALRGLALGGLYVCGRIAARIVPAKKAVFLAAMRNKGRMTKGLSKVPVTLVEDPMVGLVGAGHLAARLAAE
jgi:glucokinase